MFTINPNDNNNINKANFTITDVKLHVPIVPFKN